MDKVRAIVVQLPETKMETIRNLPGYRGRKTFGPAILAFHKDVVLERKIDKVETLKCVFTGVIPYEETEVGTICRVDSYGWKKE